MLRWYLIHTKVLAEATARANLERQGYEVHFPCLLQTTRRGESRSEQLTALFPRYLFLHLDEGHQTLKPVHSTTVVSNVVRFGSRYAIVPDEVITGLHDREDPETGLHYMQRAKPLTRGAQVRVTAGPLEGLEAIYERDAGSDRVLILMKLLGQEVGVRVPAAVISPSAAL